MLTPCVVISWSGDGGSSDAVNFMLFNGVWTLFIATPYLALAPVFFPNITNQFVILLAEALTMIFWFAGFIALAALLPASGWCSKFGPCRSLQAATVFGAFEWLVCSSYLIRLSLEEYLMVCGIGLFSPLPPE